MFPDLKFVLQTLGQNVRNEKRINKLANAADPNKKGSISFSKFVILMEINKKKAEEVKVLGRNICFKNYKIRIH
jgi:Ca2+-binding EF-hand superfamily protein